MDITCNHAFSYVFIYRLLLARHSLVSTSKWCQHAQTFSLSAMPTRQQLVREHTIPPNSASSRYTTVDLKYRCLCSIVLRLIWVPGHLDVAKNETADYLAKYAARLELLRPEPAVGSTTIMIWTMFLSWANRHLKLWQCQTGCRLAKMLLHGPDR